MAFNNSFTAVVGATYTAAQYNTYVRDNFTAIWVYTTAGDIAYATSATTLARLAGVSQGLLKSTGSALAYVAPGTNYDLLQMVSGAPAWGSLHFASVYHDTTQNVNTGSATALAFNNETIDAQGWHSLVSNNSRITVGVTGYYVASTFFQYAGAGGSGQYWDTVQFRVNGSEIFSDRRRQEVDANNKIFCITSPIFAMTAAQYVEVYLEQNSGGTRAVSGLARFTLWRIG